MTSVRRRSLCAYYFCVLVACVIIFEHIAGIFPPLPPTDSLSGRNSGVHAHLVGVLSPDSTRSAATPTSYIQSDPPLASTDISTFSGTPTWIETPAPVRITDPVTSGLPLPLSIQFDAETAVFDFPENYAGSRTKKFRSADRWTVANVGHAFIHSMGLVCNETTEFWFNGRGPPSSAKLLGPEDRLSATRIQYPVLNLLEKDTELFQHFPFQSLPLIATVRNVLEDKTASHTHPIHVLANDLPQLRTLLPLLLDLPSDRFIWAKDKTVYQSDEVLVGSFGVSRPAEAGMRRYSGISPQGTCAPIVGEMNRKLTPGFLSADSPERTKVFYLTRGVGNTRSVVNEAEILSFLRENLAVGLELVVFEPSGDVSKDAEALKHARLLIGPHGNALVNTLFLPPGLDVVEFNMFFGGSPRPCFLASSRCMGLRHWVVEPENKFEYARGPVEGTWMTVSVEAVRGVLDQIGVVRGPTVIVTDPAVAGISLPLFTEFDVDKAVFDPPENYQGKIKGNITPDRWFVADVGHAYIDGKGFVCNEDTEFWFNGRGPPSNAKLLGRDVMRGAKSIDRPVFNLLEKDTKLFEYFPFQSLPLIAVVRSAIVENDGMQVLANDVPHLRTLLPVLLDLSPDRFVWAQHNTVYESDKVLVAGYGFSDRIQGLPGRYRSAPQGTCTSIVGEMNRKLTPGFLPADSPERTKVFYVPQAGAGGVVNEEEIIATLREDLAVGLELVVFEPSGDVRKDAEVLKHARLLIGPHGGALATMIFLPPGLDVVEFSFLWGPKAHPSYLAASRCMGLRHWTVVPDLDFQGSGEGEAGLVKVFADDVLDVLQGVGVSRREPFSGPSKISDPYVAGMPLPLLIEHEVEAAVFNPPDSHPYKNKFVTPDRWFVADVGHAYIHGSGFVCNETTEFWFNGRGPPSNAKLLGRGERRGASRIEQPVFNLLEKDTEFFQHFPFQSLPLIAVVKSAIAEMDDVQILVNALPQLKSLMPLLFDLPPDRFVWAEPRTVYESDKVLVGGYGFTDRTKGLPGRYGSAPQGTCTSIVSEMNQKLTPGFLPADSPERTDIIYLTRGVGNRRSVVNEMEILSFLREELDEKLNLVVFESTGDVRKDAEGLKHARLVIGPHGGAFVNMMFLPVGLDVVEFNMLGGRPCFIASSHCMGLRHWLVEPENEFEYTRGPVEGTWFTVSVEAVRGALDRIGVLRSRDGGSDAPPERNLS